MPDTGWTREPPTSSGIYWWRADERDYEPEIHEIADGLVFRIESRRQSTMTEPEPSAQERRFSPPYVGTLDCEHEINGATIAAQEAHLQTDHAGETRYDPMCTRCAAYVDAIMRC